MARPQPAARDEDAAQLPALRAKGLTKVYGTGTAAVHALRGADLTVPEGEFVVLLGPSGSGKSTLLNILGGLDRATGGTAYFRDLELTALNERGLTAYRREHVGFVFQFYNLMPSLTAQENVELVTEIADTPMDALEALKLVDLGERAHHFPAELSGGEQQRVAIARAVAKQPTILFCDEPTGALDSQTGVKVLEVLARINAELKTTLVVITHAVAIADMADRVVRFGDGQVVSVETNATKRAASEIEW